MIYQWLNDCIWIAEEKIVSFQMVYDASLVAIAEYIKGGTTCINDMYFYANDLADALQETGVRRRFANTVFNLSKPWAPDINNSLAQAQDNIAYVKYLPLVEASIAPHSTYTTTPDSMEQVAEVAMTVDVSIHIYLHETTNEVTDDCAQYGMCPIAQHQLGILQHNHIIAVHMTSVEETDISMMADTDTVVAHCPE